MLSRYTGTVTISKQQLVKNEGSFGRSGCLAFTPAAVEDLVTSRMTSIVKSLQLLLKGECSASAPKVDLVRDNVAKVHKYCDEFITVVTIMPK